MDGDITPLNVANLFAQPGDIPQLMLKQEGTRSADEPIARNKGV